MMIEFEWWLSNYFLFLSRSRRLDRPLELPNKFESGNSNMEYSRALLLGIGKYIVDLI